jgi:hypothetical protein
MMETVRLLHPAFAAWCKNPSSWKMDHRRKAKDKHPQLFRQSNKKETLRHLFSPPGGVSRKRTNVLWKNQQPTEVALLSGRLLT